MKTAIVVGCLLLAGCVSQQEREARYLDSARSTCLAAGFPDGSEALANCTMSGVRQSEAAHAQRVDEALQRLGGALNPPPRVPLPTQTVCNRTFVRGQIVCTTQ